MLAYVLLEWVTRWNDENVMITETSVVCVTTDKAEALTAKDMLEDYWHEQCAPGPNRVEVIPAWQLIEQDMGIPQFLAARLPPVSPWALPPEKQPQQTPLGESSTAEFLRRAHEAREATKKSKLHFGPGLVGFDGPGPKIPTWANVPDGPGPALPPPYPDGKKV